MYTNEADIINTININKTNFNLFRPSNLILQSLTVYLRQASLIRPAPVESPQNRKVARVNG